MGPLVSLAMAAAGLVTAPQPDTDLERLQALWQAEYSAGHFRDAGQIQRRILKVREQTLGPDHPDVAVALNGLAETERAEGHYRAAETLYRGALAIFERTYGPKHVEVAAVLTNLGQTLTRLRRYPDAEADLRRAVAIWIDAGYNGPDSMIASNNLAVLYVRRGRYAEAEALLGRVREVFERTYGTKDLRTTAVLLNLADLYRAQKRYGEAERLFEQALAIREELLPADHPDRAAAIDMYAVLLRETRRGREAKVLVAQAGAIRMRHARANGSAWTVDARELAR